ncbi:hypothetical protein M0802_007984 [Mischocyttarus mexicanus]|nr:hypothetical protein M0802_007984 [Mischocyttarus mexicanus]
MLWADSPRFREDFDIIYSWLSQRKYRFRQSRADRPRFREDFDIIYLWFSQRKYKFRQNKIFHNFGYEILCCQCRCSSLNPHISLVIETSTYGPNYPASSIPLLPLVTG